MEDNHNKQQIYYNNLKDSKWALQVNRPHKQVKYNKQDFLDSNQHYKEDRQDKCNNNNIKMKIHYNNQKTQEE